MIDLNNIEEIKKLDQSNVYASVDELPKQCLHAWEDSQTLEVPQSYRSINKIVMTGMGGSGLGARTIESVYANSLKCPLIRINDYDLPHWVDKETLVICSSFSGTTEETIENALQAQKKGTKWMAISTGGELINFAQKCNVPYYKIDPIHNPSKQPRMAVGYSIIGQLAMASKAGIISITKQDMSPIIEAMNQVRSHANILESTDSNPAKKMAKVFYNKKIIFVAARHLIAASHTFKNQLNENSKNFSIIFDIPELNHHLMEGLQFPESNKKDLIFIFVKSNLYPKRISERINITEEVVKENRIPFLTWEAKSDNLLSQAFEFIQFGGFVNFYLSMLNGINPAPIKWVDYFKVKLGQPLGQWK